jgi:CheY-like chemotaxis protein
MLTDVNMPEITGIELVKVVKAKMKSLPVIMVTTESSPEMKEQMTAAGANGVITLFGSVPKARANLRALARLMATL